MARGLECPGAYPEWTADFGPAQLAERMGAASREVAAPLSLYVHLPFCRSLCWYCGCNVVISLIYGLSHQNAERWARTLARVLEMRPDRLAVYSFAFTG